MMEVRIEHDGLNWIDFKNLKDGDCFATSREMADIFIKTKPFDYETVDANRETSYYNGFQLPAMIPNFFYDNTKVVKLEAALSVKLERK